MSAYGWTLWEVMELTLPQVLRLYRAISAFPPMNVIVPTLLNALRDGIPDDVSAATGLPVEKIEAASNFLKSVGVEVSGG